ncbi:helix-turn-helix transcriptional regulator [Vibrio coralliilyticus]|uniref:helix-turn-helix domain-containing protein n=1 Tax=Vibrio TaxID=662 RepID=UPI0005063301|nr:MULTISPECIES: AraC family transcriptional regulator [Vibrio]KFI12769.1 AraC family transcriptional regulator [Vibrio sp. B183]NOI17324.1 helix-turn-helix transcriptional regulator [Vibrio coralliilyticus]
MKPFIENISNHPSFNWLVKHYCCDVIKQEYACAWHYHSEYELVLYLDPHDAFEGNYFAGDAVGKIDHNTLLLYGPGLPHMLSGRLSREEQGTHHTVVIWFKHQWLEKLQELIPEAHHFKRILAEAAYGVRFSKETAQRVHVITQDLEQQSLPIQAVRVMEIVLLLVEDQTRQTLSSTPYHLHRFEDDKESYQRIQQARFYIEEHYARPIKVSDLCQLLHMSESSLYRMYEKHFGVSFSEHLKQYRIGKACELLASSAKPIALIAELTGFQNLSNFNRQFKTMKGITPSAFRKQFL